ncbi:hypothetical protein [Hymenobacter cavernae]|uniref:hypothetical protein n=1 Tax=Hymenobacter cavernae TaxID=2044852 RepID=UPI00166BB21F|nr:hypothetical protein [Hymenobacter cavernae]
MPRKLLYRQKLMKKYLTKHTKKKLKWLAYYQIAGGVLGITLAFWIFLQTAKIAAIMLTIFSFITTLYLFSIYCGWQLLKGRIKKPLKLSLFNQVLQLISFSIAGFTYRFTAGIFLSIGINYTNDLNLSFNFSLSQFQLNINSNKEVATFNINLLAFYLIYFTNKLQEETKKEKLLSTQLNSLSS